MSKKQYTYPVVLTIAGSDSGGGAGIQADLKTFAALGCYGTSAITAITVQNTLGVKGIHAVPVETVAGQIEAVMEDLKPQAIKIGMVHSAELINTICKAVMPYAHIPVVFDPVMIATSGDKLLNDDTIDVLKEKLIPMAALLTPNLDEAAVLTGTSIAGLAEMEIAAAELLTEKCQAVLVKGGHLPGTALYDLYQDREGTKVIYPATKIETRNMHGTGCSLSSAVAAFLARGFDMADAVKEAITFVREALAAAQDVRLGQGHGPLNHFFNPLKTIKYEME